MKKKDSELVHVQKTFDFTNIHLHCFGINIKESCEILSNLKDFTNEYKCSGPDLYSLYGDIVIGVEHFEYDASSKNKNGSKERREIDHINKRFKEEAIKNFSSGSYQIFKDYKLDADGDIETLKDNFLRGFRIHANKIKRYKDNLNREFQINEPEIWLLVEDVSIMGPMFYCNCLIDDCPGFSLFPIFYNDIQKEVLKTDISGVIFVSTFPIENCVVLVKNNRKSYKELQEFFCFNKEDVAIQFFNNSHYACNAFLIPNIGNN